MSSKRYDERSELNVFSSRQPDIPIPLEYERSEYYIWPSKTNLSNYENDERSESNASRVYIHLNTRTRESLRAERVR